MQRRNVAIGMDWLFIGYSFCFLILVLLSGSCLVEKMYAKEYTDKKTKNINLNIKNSCEIINIILFFF